MHGGDGWQGNEPLPKLVPSGSGSHSSMYAKECRNHVRSASAKARRHCAHTQHFMLAQFQTLDRMPEAAARRMQHNDPAEYINLTNPGTFASFAAAPPTFLPTACSTTQNMFTEKAFANHETRLGIEPKTDIVFGSAAVARRRSVAAGTLPDRAIRRDTYATLTSTTSSPPSPIRRAS